MGNRTIRLVWLCSLLLLLMGVTKTWADSAVGGYVPYHAPQVAPPHHKNHAPIELKESAKLKKVYEYVYPFYQRPRYRYPFYDVYGNGQLLYGYGGRQLYQYTVFRPVEGYLRRR